MQALERLSDRTQLLWRALPTGAEAPAHRDLLDRRLKVLLSAAGYPTLAEARYPGSRLRCDNVATMPDGGLLWLENKGAWKQYWIDKGSVGIYRSYLLHPLVPGLMNKSHTVPHDISKLAALTKAHARRVGYLLLGFDSTDHPMDDDIKVLASLTKLDAAPWTTFCDSWPDSYPPKQQIKLWFWTREL